MDVVDDQVGVPADASGPWRWWQPRYELRLQRDDVDVLAWTRHRSRRLALLSRRMELAHLRLGPADLVVVDRRDGTVVHGGELTS